MTEHLERKIDDVIDALKHSRNSSARCSLLIGAGCSVTAGIPTAAGFVDLIKQKFESAFNRAPHKTYLSCMAEIGPSHRRDLIIEQVRNAQINWAHMAIAQLIKEGYVDRVLTTNFDPLVLRASAMLNEFPAVYDFATSQKFRPGELPEKAIFHLHGQSTGFVLMNTENDVKKHSKRLGPLFKDAGQARPWIVVGYSGENDPVFDHLARVKRFAYGLYWVGFKDEEPRAHIRDKLLKLGKDAYLVRGYDADRFFIELAQKLECFPPEFVERPFSFLKSSLSTLTEFPLLSGDKEIEILHWGFDLIDSAIADIEKPSIELNATSLLMAGKYEELDRLERKLAGDLLTPSLRDIFAWSHIDQGNALSDQAETKSGAEADALFAAAGAKYEAALAIKPDDDVALWSWGNVLSEQAETKSGAEADALFAAAGEKYEAALALKPDDDVALRSWGNTLLAWGNALSDQAEMKSGAEADALFAAAGAKYEAALALKPDDDVALRSWGNTLLAWGKALSDQAEMKSGAEADALFAAAGEKYAAALALKPDNDVALWSWGNALSDQAEMKSGAEADALFAAAGEKYAAALALKPDNDVVLWSWGNTLLAWGNALSEQAELKSGAEADALFAAAGEKYAAALALKPDNDVALWSWGNALSDQAEMKSGAEADALFAAAGAKYAAALALKPDNDVVLCWGYTLLAWGNALSDQAELKSGAEADALFAAAGEKYAAALALKPDDDVVLLCWGHTLLAWGNALSAQAKTKSGAEADALFAAAGAKYEAAGAKYEAALALKPDDHEALYNWGNALSAQAKTKSGAEADALFVAAGAKYEAALALKPDDHEAHYNWGNALSAQAKTKSGAEADALFAAAGEKYEAALALKPDLHEALGNWGTALSAQARTKSGAEADALFAAAGEKYEAALAIKPDKHDALNNWGVLYVSWSAAKEGDEVERMLQEAEAKLVKAEEIKTGSGSYNLACVAARRGDAASCLEWLQRSRETGKLPDRQHLLADPDLASVRDQPWFRTFLDDR